MEPAAVLAPVVGAGAGRRRRRCDRGRGLRRGRRHAGVHPGGRRRLPPARVARWIQTGSVWQIDQFLPYQAQGNYPNSGDVVVLAAVLPWHDDFALRFVALPFVAATGVAVYALGRELGAPAAAAVIYGAVAVTIPSVAVSAWTSSSPTRSCTRPSRPGPRSSCAGPAVAERSTSGSRGSRWAWPSASSGTRCRRSSSSSPSRPPARSWRGAVAGRGPRRGADGRTDRAVRRVLAAAQPRRVGQPVLPGPVAPFGVTIFDAPYDRYRALAGFPLSDYFDDPSILRHYALPAFNRTLGPGLGRVRGRSSGRRHRGPAGPATRLARRRRGRLRRAARRGLPVHAVLALGGGTRRPGGRQHALRGARPAAGRGGDGVGGRTRPRPGDRRSARRGAAVADGIAGRRPGARARWAAGGRTPRVRRRRRGGVAALGSGARRGPARGRRRRAGAAAVATAGYAVQRRFNDNRYPSLEAPLAWVREDHHRRVGLAGLWDVDGIYPVLPSFGPRLGNEGPLRRSVPRRDAERVRRGPRLLRRPPCAADATTCSWSATPSCRGRGRARTRRGPRAAGYVVVARSPDSCCCGGRDAAVTAPAPTRWLLWSLLGGRPGCCASFSSFTTDGVVPDLESFRIVADALRDAHGHVYAIANSHPPFVRWPYPPGYFPFIAGADRFADVDRPGFPVGHPPRVHRRRPGHRLGRAGTSWAGAGDGPATRLPPPPWLRSARRSPAVSGYHGQDRRGGDPARRARACPVGAHGRRVAGPGGGRADRASGGSIKTIPLLMVIGLLPLGPVATRGRTGGGLRRRRPSLLAVRRG